MSKLTSSEIQDKARILVSREVNVCLSSLISTLASAYSAQCIENGGTDRGLREAAAAMSSLAEQAFGLTSSVLDYDEAAIQAGWSKSGSVWFRPATQGEVEDGTAEERAAVDGCPAGAAIATTAEEACEHDDLEPYDREVFEHWAVSTWLGDMLAAFGEKVDDDFAGMVVWARCTTGQAIYADGVIERLTAELHKA